MKKLTYIISDIDKALAFEWAAEGLRDQYDMFFILIAEPNTNFEEYLRVNSIRYIQVNTEGYFNLTRRVYKILKKESPDIIHCHLRRAELAGITASRILGTKKRIFTRHSSTYNHLYHPKGVFIDKRVNTMATHIVAISENVKEVLINRENVNPSKVRLIPHGFDLNSFTGVEEERVAAIRNKYEIDQDKKIVGVIARYTLWKGYEYLIPGLAGFLIHEPNTHFIFANAKGNDKSSIKELMRSSLPDGSYTEIEFEKDLPALYALFDYYVHTPFDESVEAFGQTYVEALAAGVPSIFTLSGIAREFIEHEKNALVVPFKDSEAITSNLVRLDSDAELCVELTQNGQSTVERFNLNQFITNLKEVYDA